MNKPEQARRAHRIARVNYLPRALGFGGVFIALLLLSVQGKLGTVGLLMGVFSFILYPHLVYLHARFARNSKGAEQFNLMMDSVLLGTWAAALGFNIWITFVLMVATLLNNAVNGGIPRLALAALCFAAGSLLWVLVMGLEFRPDSSMVLTLWMALSCLLYVLGVGVTHFRQNTQLARAHKDIARNTDVFRSLLELGAVSNEAEGVSDLVNKLLDHFRRMRPEFAFGLLLFDPQRPKLLIQGGFRGIDDIQQHKILEQVVEHNNSERRRTKLVLEHGGRSYQLIPLGRHLDRATGYLLVDQVLNEELIDAVDLFEEQLTAALQNKLLNEELRKAAETDGLTGLYNRAYLEEQLAAAIAGKEAHHTRDFSIIMLDVVGLKRANDELGHEAGDQLICAIAEHLQENARTSDVVARFGGDEFVVLCLDCKEANARRAVQRLTPSREASASLVHMTDGRESEIPIEISVGVAGSDCHEAVKVLPTADARMYEHKEQYYKRRGLAR